MFGKVLSPRILLSQASFFSPLSLSMFEYLCGIFGFIADIELSIKIRSVSVTLSHCCCCFLSFVSHLTMLFLVTLMTSSNVIEVCVSEKSLFEKSQIHIKAQQYNMN